MGLIRLAAALTLALSPYAPRLARADGPEAARVELSTRVFTRTLRFEGEPRLGEHRSRSGMMAARAELFPGSLAPDHPLADLGAYFDLSRSVGGGTGFVSGAPGSLAAYSTRELGLLVRQRIRRQSLSLRFGYGDHRFELEPDPSATPGAPTVDYRFLRVGVEAQLLVVRELRVTPTFSYLPVFDSGGLASSRWFPRATSGGITTGLELAYRFIGAVELTIAFEYRRFFHELHPQPGDPYAASGAIDGAIVTSIGARYVFRRATPGPPD